MNKKLGIWDAGVLVNTQFWRSIVESNILMTERAQTRHTGAEALAFKVGTRTAV
jgi:hypothetical protein